MYVIKIRFSYPSSLFLSACVFLTILLINLVFRVAKTPVVYSTFVCPTELIAFSERIAEFQKLDCEVVGVSTDSHFSHLAWNNMPRKVISFHLIINNNNLSIVLSKFV